MKAERGNRQRLDAALVARGLASGLDQARALIMAGEVQLNGQKADKADRGVRPADVLALREKNRYVSRGALKLAAAIERLGIDLHGLKAIDIGISTGGFSDYLLQHGAAAVAGVDVTVAQVDPRLRADPRLRLLQKNARFLERRDIPFDPDLIVMDLSFISIAAIEPAWRLFPRARILALVKPQFEARPGQVGRGGVMRDGERRRGVLLAVKRRLEGLGYGLLGWAPAGVKGRRGNQEYFFLLQHGKTSRVDDTMIADEPEV